METIILLLVMGTVGLIVWSIVVSKQTVLTRMPKDKLDIKVRKPVLDFARIFPTRAILEKSGLDIKIKKNIDNAHLQISPGAFFNLKLFIIILNKLKKWY